MINSNCNTAFQKLTSFLVSGRFCSEEVLQKWIKSSPHKSLSEVASFFCENPHAKESLEALNSAGIADSTLLKVLNSPKAAVIFRMDPNKITDCFQNLAKLGFGDLDRTRLIVACPDIILCSQKTVQESYAWLKQTFTEKQARHMVGLKPQVLSLPKHDLLEKANYLFARMRVIGREVAYSGALCHSLERIKCRHIFLLRSGRYEYPDGKAKIHRLEKNPSLQVILDTSDRDFVTKVARLTLPEFIVFKKLLAEEQEEEIFNNDE